MPRPVSVHKIRGSSAIFLGEVCGRESAIANRRITKFIAHIYHHTTAAMHVCLVRCCACTVLRSASWCLGGAHHPYPGPHSEQLCGAMSDTVDQFHSNARVSRATYNQVSVEGIMKQGALNYFKMAPTGQQLTQRFQVPSTSAFPS